MEYVYSALLLHSAGKDVTEDSVTKVLKAAGVTADSARVKALTTSLEGVNIDEAVATAVAVPTAAAPAAAAAPAEGGADEDKPDEKEEEKEEKVSEEDAAAGL
ncbi:MAG: 50S ribosomal protein P1, partial [Thermoplasmata archaeon]|nr:50S ribosomal protein P1 [Thermoplasmata archaeon]